MCDFIRREAPEKKEEVNIKPKLPMIITLCNACNCFNIGYFQQRV
jgi:hypothetical protein